MKQLNTVIIICCLLKEDNDDVLLEWTNLESVPPVLFYQFFDQDYITILHLIISYY